MKISVVIPCHQDNKIVRECLNQIINQKKNHELIIACDDFIFEYKQAKIVKSQKKLYANGIRNFGAKYAEGDYLLFLDSDIIVKNNFIESVEEYIKNNNVEILNFPTGAERSNNLFANYKGHKESYQTGDFLKKNYGNIKIPFFGYAVLFKKTIFLELGGWPEIGKYDYIMEHEGFQKTIYKSKYKNDVTFDIKVDHYHHKNLDLFKQIIFRTKIWTLKKLRGEVDLDEFKSKKNALFSCLIFLSFFTLFINSNISLILILIYIIGDKGFLFFLFKKNKLLFTVFFFIHLVYYICIFLGAFKATIEHIFDKK